MKSGHFTITWSGRDQRSWGKQNEPPPTIPKAGPHPKKVMCIWWDWKGVLYYELLLEKQTINSNKYSSQLDLLKIALNEKHLELVNRKCIIFHQDNTRPHVSLMTRQKLLQLGWEVLVDQLYSPDIAPAISIYFSLYKILLKEKKIQFSGRLKKAPGTFLCSKR